MKKLLAFYAFALTVGYVQAQTTSGHMMIGGNVGYTSQKFESINGDTEQKQFYLRPQFGYFAADNLVLGLNVDYSNIKSNYENLFGDELELTSKSTTLAPFIRYYIFTSSDKFAFYAEASAGIGFSKRDDYNSGEDLKGSSFTARISPGFSYFFNEKWALDLQLNGISYWTNDSNTDSDVKDDKTSAFTFDVTSFNPALGFRYFIGK